MVRTVFSLIAEVCLQNFFNFLNTNGKYGFSVVYLRHSIMRRMLNIVICLELLKLFSIALYSKCLFFAKST